MYLQFALKEFRWPTDQTNFSNRLQQIPLLVGEMIVESIDSCSRSKLSFLSGRCRLYSFTHIATLPSLYTWHDNYESN